MILNLIIGKNSNLSVRLSKKLGNCILISARDILVNSDILREYKTHNINLIFNNFQPAIDLGRLDNASRFMDISINSTAIVLDYFKETNINKIIYTSSSSVYGNNILCEESDELKPLNLHASLKIVNEKLIEKYCLEKGVDYTIGRIFNMYGGDDNFSIISKIINAYKNNIDLNIVNNGNAIRDFIHIDDVVDVYSKLLNIKNIQIVNIGTGKGSSIKNILDFLNNHNIKIVTNNIKKEELKISTADTNKLKQFLKKEKFLEVEDYLIKEFNI